MPRKIKRQRLLSLSRLRSTTPVPEKRRRTALQANHSLDLDPKATKREPREIKVRESPSREVTSPSPLEREEIPLPRGPRPWKPKLHLPYKAIAVVKTPGGLVRVADTPVVLTDVTPGGSVRRKKVVEQSPFLRDEVGLDIEEGQEAARNLGPQMGTWFSQSEITERMSPSRSISEQSEYLGDLPSVTVNDQDSFKPGPSGCCGPSKTSAVRVVATPSTSGTAAAAKTNRNAAEVENEGSDLDSDYDDEYDVEQIIASQNPMWKAIPDDNELDDDDLRRKIHSVETEMDAAIDRLVGESSGFDWQEDFASFKGVQETFTGPTPGPVEDYDTPYEAFCDIWDDDIIGLMVTETNKYAHQTIKKLREKGKLKPNSRLHRWVETDANEIRVLLAMYVLTGIAQRSSQHEYWKTSGYLQLPYFRSLMAFNRFILLNKFLHFADNSDESPNLPRVGGKMLCAKLANIAPLLGHLNSKFESLYNLQQDIAIDESLTLYKGRLSWVHEIRSKAARFVIQSFELCESRSGYLYRFEIYKGKNSSAVHDAADGEESPNADLAGKSAQVVLDLLKGLENRGHCVTMDNFYNSPALARHLKSLGYDCLGMLRSNRKNVPEKIKKLPKKVEKGKITALHSGDVACISWQDSKMVNMISTYHNSETTLVQKAGKEVLKPRVVLDYNNTMGGVDIKDQKLALYLLERKRCLKWYVKIFKRLLNVSVYNAFIMFNESRKRRNLPLMTRRDFREELAGNLLARHHQDLPDTPAPVAGTEMRLERDVHVPGYLTSNSRRRCRICSRKGRRTDVRSKCVTCDAFLCFESCWSDCHSLQELPDRESRAVAGTEMSLERVVHIPGYVTSNSRRRCRICSRKGRRTDVRSKCVTCDAFLCFGRCWSDWHSLQELPERESRANGRCDV